MYAFTDRKTVMKLKIARLWVYINGRCPECGVRRWKYDEYIRCMNFDKIESCNWSRRYWVKGHASSLYYWVLERAIATVRRKKYPEEDAE